MAYTKRLRAVIPVDPDVDLEVLRWLTRESFERTAAGENLRIIEFTEAELPADDIPPKVGKQLGRPVTSFAWHRFDAVAAAVTSA